VHTISKGFSSASLDRNPAPLRLDQDGPRLITHVRNPNGETTEKYTSQGCRCCSLSRDPARPTHAPTTQLPVVDDCLQIGGIALTELARAPADAFYAYDRSLITQRVERFAQAPAGRAATALRYQGQPDARGRAHLTTLMTVWM